MLIGVIQLFRLMEKVPTRERERERERCEVTGERQPSRSDHPQSQGVRRRGGLKANEGEAENLQPWWTQLAPRRSRLKDERVMGSEESEEW